ncbi:MAG: T9SS type A sorting domain-containing protein [Bacteroidetes bacterium]|nr:T9SS type A sorting domain-containing protein [Bacteroidota bacterium]
MKKITLTLVLFLLSNISFSQSAWQVVTLPSNITKTTRLNFTDANTGFLLANAIYKTNDAGNSWVQKTTTLDVNAFFSLSFLSSNTGYFCQSSGEIFKTTNGGNNWLQLPNNINGLVMKFINVNTGWIAGSRFVSKTTDGGLNFITVNLVDTVYAMFCMDFLNDNTGWVAGMKSICKTTNGGLNWLPQSNFAPSISTMAYGMDFINESTGFLTGTGGMICKTTDSGITWEKTNPGTSLMRDIKFINNQTGWACGGAGNLFKTTNTGINWTAITIDPSYGLMDIEFTNENTGWITTSTNNLLKTTNGGVVFISQTSSEIPDKFELYQNYPNPFNPSTTIKYKIKNSEHVTIKVFDSKGNEVETLANENQTAGSYSVMFNASKLSSGVYYYKLISNNFSETKKLILVK